MESSNPLQAKIKAMASELVEEFGEIDEENGLGWLDAVETRAVEIGDALARELVSRKAADRAGGEGEGEREAVCPECGKLGRYRGRREREMISRRGPVTINEAEYYCPGCRRSFFPGDPRVGG